MSTLYTYSSDQLVDAFTCFKTSNQDVESVHVLRSTEILILAFCTVVNLTLIDLPGLTKVAVGKYNLIRFKLYSAEWLVLNILGSSYPNQM